MGNLMKDIEKQAKDLLKDKKKVEQAGDMVENFLEKEKKKTKDKKKQKTIDTIIKAVDDATTTKKKKK
ncbi:MAG: hypothetical protein IKP79_00175 [Bacilli bacterium]|nr:hypothetical protein [Bacilli bacterium]